MIAAHDHQNGWYESHTVEFKGLTWKFTYFEATAHRSIATTKPNGTRIYLTIPIKDTTKFSSPLAWLEKWEKTKGKGTFDGEIENISESKSLFDSIAPDSPKDEAIEESGKTPSKFPRQNRKARKERWIGARIQGKVCTDSFFEGIVVGIHLDSQLKVQCDDGSIAFPLESECEILTPSNLKPCSPTLTLSPEVADSPSPRRKPAESKRSTRSTTTLTLNSSGAQISQPSLFPGISENFEGNPENTTLLLVASPAPEPVTRERKSDSHTPNQPSGERESDCLSNADPDSLLLNSLMELSIEDFERFLEDSEWRDIRSTLRKSSKRKNAERDTADPDYLLFPTLTSNRGATNRAAGHSRCEKWWREQGLVNSGLKLQLSAPAMAAIMGFPLGWYKALEAENSNLQNTAPSKIPPAESGPDTSRAERSHQPKRGSSSIESSTSTTSDNGATASPIEPIESAGSLLGVNEPWNPDNFGPLNYATDEEGQLTIFPSDIEPPDPDDYESREEYESAWREWESGQPDRQPPASSEEPPPPALTPSKCFACHFAERIRSSPLFTCLADPKKYFTKETAKECDRFTPAGKLEEIPKDPTAKRPRRPRGQGSGSFITTYASQSKYGKKYPQISYQVEFGGKRRSIYLPAEKVEQIRELDRTGKPIREVLESIGCPKSKRVLEEYKEFLKNKLGV